MRAVVGSSREKLALSPYDCKNQNFSSQIRMERETGLEPATLSLEG